MRVVLRFLVGWICFAGVAGLTLADEATTIRLNLRNRVEVAPKLKRWHTVTTPTDWNPRKTAIVVCDMWDQHWCPESTTRVAEMAPHMDEVIQAARSLGVFIIHCPSDTMDFYKDTPQRKRAQDAPMVETKRPLERWCKIDLTREAPLPIDDSDGGCDCAEPVKNYRAWSRQIADIEIHDEDAITDSDEAYRLMRSRGIENVIVMGVHTNMCVLGRPFSIRQMVYQGMNVVLMRDMTDTMYNPAMKPFVSHFSGTDLVVEHIEKYWCPTITSSDFLGKPPFRFGADKRPHVVILTAEDEYRTEETLPIFAGKYLQKDFRVSFVFNDFFNKFDLPGIDQVEDADVLLVSVRRRPLPPAQLEFIRKYVSAGKPVVGIRTASHAFSLRSGVADTSDSQVPLEAWPEFDREVIGGNYQGHTANESKSLIQIPEGVTHPILTGLPTDEFPSAGTLYLNSPLPKDSQELLRGRVEGLEKQEPVAWTFKRQDGGRTFYTSLGHKGDFSQPPFQRLLLNAICWAADIAVPTDDQFAAAGVAQKGPEDVPSPWVPFTVPGLWEKQPGLESYDGFAWFRCEVKIPETWAGRGAFLLVENVDNSCESFVNGVKVGVSGGLPPKYTNGVDNIHRYVIPEKTLKPGEINTIAIRVYDEGGAGGFKSGPPQLIAGNEAISLEGNWLFRTGDDLAWATIPTSQLAGTGEQPPPALKPFAKVIPAPAVNRFATVIRREAQQTALSAQESMDHFKIPEDLAVDLVLAEPEVAQPLFMNFDERGRMWVMQYLQYPEPAGLTLLSKDQWWRAVYDKVPDPPPQGEKGLDKITIHEDTDGDGVYDKHVTFVDDLNIATAFVQGRGGLWVLNPPYLLFYADKDGDDVPDGDPEVHLSGFGIEDTHSVVSSLRWGPDGWLYGAQGSTVSGSVRIGLPTKDEGKRPVPTVHSLGQNIWRYHPVTRTYEIFSEGGGNAFGLEIDSAGRIFSGHNGGNTRGFHYMQGAYLQKGFSKHGPLSNPYSFGYFPAMEHHNVPRFTHEFIIYEGSGGPFGLPACYQGKLFGAAAILNHVVMSDVERVGSTFKTKDIGYAIDSSDTWFRPVDVKDGPDGGVYVADWYDGQLAHTANYQGGLDREHGRIYRIRSKSSSKPGQPIAGLPQKSIANLTSMELVKLLASPDRWHRETARRLLADRRDSAIVPAVKKQLFDVKGQLALELLWGLYLSGGLDEATALKALDHAEPQVRLWSIRLLADDRRLPSDIAARAASLALTEPDIEVRCQLAASAKRLPPEQSLPILKNLMMRDEDLADPRQPLMIWWGLESTIDPASPAALTAISPQTNLVEMERRAAEKGASESPVLRLFEDRALWTRPLVQKEILPRLMRRFASTGQRSDLAICARLLKGSPNAETTKGLMQGFEEAFQGRSLNNVPAELVTALSAAGGGSLSLKIRQGDMAATEEALLAIQDEKTPAGKRAEYVNLFGEIKYPKVVPVLLKTLVTTPDDGLKAAILTALQAYGDAEIAQGVLEQYGNFNEDVRAVAQSLLVSRKAWALSLLDAVDRGDIVAASLPLDTVRRMTVHRDDRVAQLIEKHWGSVEGATSAEMQQMMEHYATVLVGAGDPYPGKKIYMQMCGKCHTLHADGGKIGPDLTTYKRDDIRQMLLHIVNPSAEIREGFETQVAVLKDGRVVTGFLVEQDPQTVTLRSPDGQTISLERSELDELNKSRKSLMPEGQLKDLSEEQLRNLFAYLRSSQPLND
ncbi:PVC-type heme-binding CxxCH protein [Schlesneria sp. DSM 10557]|uniref:PVC-type heme-binding CxxCH protein n=1 Tax=Schlesneria sp. DSM 10557 TaxID=3044399 RepID=UPI0035A19DFD